MRSFLSPVLAVVLAAAMAIPVSAQVSPNRFVTVGNEHWGYVQSGGAAVTFPDTVMSEGPGFGFRAGLLITVLTRNGQPVTRADAEGARSAAAAACRMTRRRFDPNVRPILLRRGGLYFPGACG